MKLSLKHLILAVAMLAVALTLFGSIYSGYRTNEQNLIENGLETNRVYAQKLASTTDLFFRTALQTLEQSAKALTPWMEAGASEQQLLAEAERLRLQTNTLNSVVIVSADGTIVQNSPQNLELIGKKLDSQGGKQALLERKPLISEPYMAITGRLIIFISYPIFDEQGQYLGLVGGSLYLREDNFLNELLGEHFYHDGSYVYVVDAKGHIIYHQDLLRVNDDVSSNQVVQKLMNGQSGAERVSNTEHVDMLAGYAYVPTLGWGIVSQRPTAMALEANRKMIDQMLLNALPILLVSIAIIFLFPI